MQGPEEPLADVCCVIELTCKLHCVPPHSSNSSFAMVPCVLQMALPHLLSSQHCQRWPCYLVGAADPTGHGAAHFPQATSGAVHLQSTFRVADAFGEPVLVWYFVIHFFSLMPPFLFSCSVRSCLTATSWFAVLLAPLFYLFDSCRFARGYMQSDHTQHSYLDSAPRRDWMHKAFDIARFRPL